MNRHRYCSWNSYSMFHVARKSKMFNLTVKKSFMFAHAVYIGYSFNERADSQHWLNKLFAHENRT